MANGDKELDVGRTELTLDRHPTLLSSSPSSVSESLSPRRSEKDNEELIKDLDSLVSPLNVTDNVCTSKEDNIDESRDTQQEKEPGIQIEDNETEKIATKDAITTADLPSVSTESDKVTVGKIFNENHYGNESQISELVNIANASSNISPNKTRYYHGKKLNSCLKKKNLLKDTNSKSRNVNFPEDDNFVKEFVEPVDPWRDGKILCSYLKKISVFKNSALF